MFIPLDVCWFLGVLFAILFVGAQRPCPACRNKARGIRDETAA